MSSKTLAVRAIAVRLLAVLLFTFVPLLGALTPNVAAQAARPRYDIDLNLDIDAARADVNQVVTYTNRTSDNLTSLVFHITAAYYGAFDLHSTLVGDQQVSATLDGIVLEVPLSQALPPRASTTVTFDFTLNIPQPGNLRFGFSQGVVALGNWYPVLAVYRTGAFTYNEQLPVGWDRHQQGTPDQLSRGVEPGDAFFTDTADYTVDLNLNRAAKVAHTGNRVSSGSNSFRLSASAVRDFALAVSDRYETAVTQVGSTSVTAYFLPEHRSGGQQYVDAASRTTAWLNGRLGAYPYATLYVVETISNDSAWVGQEYPGIVFISSQITAGPTGVDSYLFYLVAHEVVHQWFYGLVGNDQLYEPWVDEALTTHMSYRFLESVDAGLGQATWRTLADRRASDAATYADQPVNTSIYDYENEAHYFAMVYRKGAAFLEEVRQLMGDQAYLAAVRTYFQRHSGGIATGRNLLNALEEGAVAEIRPIVARYFSYPEYRVDSTATATPGSTPTPTAPAAVATGAATPLATGEATTGTVEATATVVATGTVAATATTPRPANTTATPTTAAPVDTPAATPVGATAPPTVAPSETATATPVPTPLPSPSPSPEPSPTGEAVALVATATLAPEPVPSPTAASRTGLPEGTALAVAAIVLTATGLIGLAVWKGRLG